MDESAYSAYLSRYLSAPEVEQSIAGVRRLERWLEQNGPTLESATVRDLRAYLKRLIRQDKNTFEELFNLISFYEYSPRVDLDLYLADVVRGAMHFEDIHERVLKNNDYDVAFRLERSVPKPPLGTDSKRFPEYAVRLLRQLHACLSEEDVSRALIDANDLLPPIQYETERALYLAADSLDEYLLASAALQRLKKHALQKLDFKWKPICLSEEYVHRADAFQELLSGVRRGNRLYVTLEPHLPAYYLAARSPNERRYYACSDPCIRASFLSGKPAIPALWCERCVYRYCEKYSFILGRPLSAELVESAVLGDAACRIAILLEPESAGDSEPIQK